MEYNKTVAYDYYGRQHKLGVHLLSRGKQPEVTLFQEGPRGGVRWALIMDEATTRQVADMLFSAFGQEILFAWNELDLAIEYAKAKCPQCQEGECELGGDEHDLSVYYSLPEGVKDELKRHARKVMNNSTANEALGESVSSVVEELASYPEFDPKLGG